MRAFITVLIASAGVATWFISNAADVATIRMELRYVAMEREAQERAARRAQEYREYEERCRDGHYFRHDPRYAQQMEECPREPWSSLPARHLPP